MRFTYSERRSYFRKDRYPKEGNGLFCCLRFFFFVPWGGFGPAFPLILLGFFSSLDRLSIPIDAEKSSEAILSKGICIWSQNSWSTRSSMEKLYGESNLCYDKRASPALLSFRGEISMGKKRRDNRNRILREGQYQRKDGRYRFRIRMPKAIPHVCRHTFCSNMAKSGMNPMNCCVWRTLKIARW